MSRVVDNFLKLVQIDAPSKQEKPMADELVSQLKALNFEVQIDDSAKDSGSNTGNIVAMLKGTGAGEIVLSAHMDAVDPCIGIKPVIGEDGVIRSSGDTILSSDDRSGVASIIEAVSRIQEQSEKAYPTVIITFTVQEEVGLVGAKYLDESIYANSPLTIVADGDGDPGTICIGAPYHYTFKAKFTGKASHAGVEPEKGISAIVVASKAISAIEWGRLDHETSSNLGLIKGGRADNIVAEELELTGECRSLDKQKVEKAKIDIQESFERAALEAGAKIEIDWDLEYDGYKYAEDDENVLLLKKAAQSVGLTPRLEYSGGGSDANIIAGKGAKSVVLGTGMTNFHSVDECIKVEHLEQTADFIEAIIYQVAQEG